MNNKKCGDVNFMHFITFIQDGDSSHVICFDCVTCSILKSVAAVRRENTSASNAFVFVCVFSSLPPALCTAAAFYLSGQQSGFSELAGHV